jgi:hypothetical protein
MDDELARVLRMVAAGELTPEEAEPVVASLSGAGTPRDDQATLDAGTPRDSTSPRDPGAPRETGPGPRSLGDEPLRRTPERADRLLRLQVVEGGRSVVNLRIPMSLAGMASSIVPGLSGAHGERIREAIRSGTVGRIIEVQDEDGDGVIISTE